MKEVEGRYTKGCKTPHDHTYGPGEVGGGVWQQGVKNSSGTSSGCGGVRGERSVLLW